MQQQDRSPSIQSRAHLTALACAAFEQAGATPEAAADAADILVEGDLMGFHSHGLRRVIAYAARLRRGSLNPRPQMHGERLGPSLMRLDGDNGLGPAVAAEALRRALDLAGETGLGLVGVRNGSHFGAGSPYALRACNAGMVLVAGTNAIRSLAPTGGTEARVGNNPLVIAAPARRNPHFMLDMAMSIAARGRIRAARERGDPIPQGLATGPDGLPTTDPAQALRGMMLPIGGHKGYGLAVGMDILAGVLTGALFGTDPRSMLQQMDLPQGNGHFFLAIDPGRFMARSEFRARMDTLLDELLSTPAADPERPVRYPGHSEQTMRALRMRDGIPLPVGLLRSLEALARGETIAETATH